MKHLHSSHVAGKRVIILAALASITSLGAKGQTIIASEGFNNTTTVFTVTGPDTFLTGTSTATERPASSPFAFEGTHGWGVNNGTIVATSSPFNTSSFSNISLSFRLASFSANVSTNGHDLTDSVLVEVSPDNGTTFYRTLAVYGGSATGTNSWYPYTGAAVASTAYDGDAAVVGFAPTSGGASTTPQYSLLQVTGLPAVPSLVIRITAKNNAANERWVIDSFNLVDNTPLSADLLQFDANVANGAVQLSWRTSCESSTEHFTVEQSRGENVFAPLTNVAANNAPCADAAHAYAYNTAVPAVRTFYRLAMADRSGATTYSRTVTVAGSLNETLSGTVRLYPVPTGSRLQIEGLTRGEILRITDITGRTLHQWTSTGTTETADLSNLIPGVYLLQSENASGRTVLRFEKQ